MNLAVAFGAMPFVCECYPHGWFTATHYTALKDTNRRLEALGVPILPMLAAVDDGAGRWKDGFSQDAAHPNAVGHHEMFGGLGPSITDIFAPEQIEAKRRARRHDQKRRAEGERRATDNHGSSRTRTGREN